MHLVNLIASVTDSTVLLLPLVVVNVKQMSGVITLILLLLLPLLVLLVVCVTDTISSIVADADSNASYRDCVKRK